MKSVRATENEGEGEGEGMAGWCRRCFFTDEQACVNVYGQCTLINHRYSIEKAGTRTRCHF